MGDIERLDRKIEDVRDTVRGPASRLVTTGFGTGVFPFSVNLDDAVADGFVSVTGSASLLTDFLTPFPGSVIGLSVISHLNYSGVPGSNYNTFEVYIDSAATGLSVQIAGGSRSAYVVQDKGEDVFAPGSRIQVYKTKTGSPLGATTTYHAVVVWVTNT